jgi:hypothetical protein
MVVGQPGRSSDNLMIYISIDNDHQGELALSLIRKYEFASEDITFISHISKRNVTIPASDFKIKTIAGHPLSSGSGYKNPMSYVRAISHHRLLDRILKFNNDDILIIITEYQINNALLAKKMKHTGGKVYLFDEGIGFYFNNSPFHLSHTSFIDHIFLFAYNLAFKSLNIPAYAKKGFEGKMYVRIRDKYIDFICSRMRLPIDRTAPVIGYRNFLTSELADLPKKNNEAIFFANNLESFGLEKEELIISQKALIKMAKTFSKVYLKIHPSDWVARNKVYHFYIQIIVEHKNIELIDNSISGNDAIRKIRPKIVVGAMGAVMFDAFFFHCQPIFLFHLLPSVKSFGVCEFTLKNLGYHYIETIEQITPNYFSNVEISTLIFDDAKIWPINSQKILSTNS